MSFLNACEIQSGFPTQRVHFKTVYSRFLLSMEMEISLCSLSCYTKVGGWGVFALGFPWQHRAQRTHSWEEMMCWPVSPHCDPLLAKHKHLSLYICTCGSWLPISEEPHESHRNASLKASERLQIFSRSLVDGLV